MALKELLTGTAGMTRLAVEYADGVQTGKIDGDDFGIAMNHGTVKFVKNRNGHVDVEISDGTHEVLVQDRDVRGVFAIFYGALAAEFGETIDTGEPKPVPPTPNMLSAIKLLRTVRMVTDGDAVQDPAQEQLWRDATDALLAQYPVPA